MEVSSAFRNPPQIGIYYLGYWLEYISDLKKRREVLYKFFFLLGIFGFWEKTENKIQNLYFRDLKKI